MIDETTDITNLEQVTIIIVMRRVDEDFTVYEEFLGFIMLIQLLLIPSQQLSKMSW